MKNKEQLDTPKNIRKLVHKKSELKLEALHRWKSGLKVSEISKDLQISRETIYRWIHASDKNLSKQLPRRRISVDEQTKMRILELWFLLKKPKLSVLKESLRGNFGIQLTPSKLRRYLKKWGVFEYRPSSLFEVILIEQGWRRVASSSARDGGLNEETSP